MECFYLPQTQISHIRPYVLDVCCTYSHIPHRFVIVCMNVASLSTICVLPVHSTLKLMAPRNISRMKLTNIKCTVEKSLGLHKKESLHCFARPNVTYTFFFKKSN